MNRDLIKKRFEKSLNTYNDNALVQKIMAEKLVAMIKKQKYESIWEIGCGTGILTKDAIQSLSFNTYVTNDIVEKCQEYISKISMQIKFMPVDMLTFLKNDTNSYDLIMSNAVFQWIENIRDIVPALIARLRPNGYLIFSTFGKENFREINLTLGKTLEYYDKDDWENILSGFKHKIKEEIITLPFDKPISVLKHIKYTGVNSIESMAWTKSDMFKFENSYKKYCQSTPTLTYNPLYIIVENTLK